MENKMKVLIAYDGVHPIEYFIEDLKRTGLPHKVDARVLTVVESYITPVGSPAGLAVTAGSRLKRDQARARKMAARAAKTIQSSFRGWSVKPEVVCAGSPAAAIVEKADKWKPDLIVIGSHSASVVARFFLGSAARSVLLHSKCSVRIVRKHSKSKGSPRLIIGMDGSFDSQMAVRAVGARVWPKGTSVRLVTGFDQNMAYMMAFHRLPASKKIHSHEQGEEAWIRRMTAPYAEVLENAGLHVANVIKAGTPWKVLAAEAEKWKADCVFVGARGLGGFSRFLLGSVSNTVASRVHCSVEVVRPNKMGTPSKSAGLR